MIGCVALVFSPAAQSGPVPGTIRTLRGDLVEVVTDKTVYREGEPIHVTLNYSNYGQQAQDLTPNTGGISAALYVTPVGEFEPVLADIHMLPVQYYGDALVGAHSKTAIRYHVLKSRKLKKGSYRLFVRFEHEYFFDKPLLQTTPDTVIHIRQRR